MIKKLKFKFIFIVMAIVTAIIVLIFSSFYILMEQSEERQAVDLMHAIAINDGFLAPTPPPKNNDFFSARATNILYEFSVELDGNNQIINVINRNPTNYSDSDIENIVLEILAKKNNGGIVNDTIRYLIETRPYGKIIVAVDYSMELNTLSRLLKFSAMIAGTSFLVILAIVYFISEWAIRPVKNAFNKQKQFIGDASHELNTPLTVMNTNLDVVLAQDPDNKWLNYMKQELERMRNLVQSLLYLAKVDFQESKMNFYDFNLSEAVESICLMFESLIFENKKTLKTDIDKDITLKGDENRIRQAIINLVDNAVKNTCEGGLIEVSLKSSGGKKIIAVTNIGEPIKNEDKTKIFERFYRTDYARSREKGGYGLGLSIVKSIVDAHKGKIEVNNLEGKVEFKLILNK